MVGKTTRVRTQQPDTLSRVVPIPHLRVSATTSGTADTLLTVRNDIILRVEHLAVVNTTGGSVTLNLNSIPAGGSIGDDNAEMVAVPIPGNTTADLTDYIGQMYDEGYVLQAYSNTANALVIHGWATEIL